MSTEKTPQQQDYESRVYDEMLDGFDEELEMEIDDDRMNALIADVVNSEVEGGGLSRSFYFKELFRLQGELVKLQDWVVHKKLKVVVLFEGRDTSGKGGVIDAIRERVNPRQCRVVALAKPTETERGQWYSGVLPDRITVYRLPILRMCADDHDVVDEVRITVIHEIAHHFGIDEDRLHELGWG